MNQRKQLGQEGENMAAQFLTDKGFEIVARNHREGRTEIDIIAQKEKLLVFVEVKARSSASHGYPEEAVSAAKAARIVAAAEQYISKTNWQGLIRFDIVSILVHKQQLQEILHLEDAFY